MTGCLQFSPELGTRVAFGCVLLWLSAVHQYAWVLLKWSWGNENISPCQLKLPWRMWVNKRYECTVKCQYDYNRTKQKHHRVYISWNIYHMQIIHQWITISIYIYILTQRCLGLVKCTHPSDWKRRSSNDAQIEWLCFRTRGVKDLHIPPQTHNTTENQQNDTFSVIGGTVGCHCSATSDDKVDIMTTFGVSPHWLMCERSISHKDSNMCFSNRGAGRDKF